jgi:hypothetical protein
MNALMPSMGSQGMSGIGAPPVQSPAQNPQGMPKENMGQVMALARKMSDMQLADVLAGKNMDVPQFAAMTEAMGRRSLRNAMKGAQAQGQLQKPNLKQQTLAELQAEEAPPLTPQMNPALQPQQAMTAAEGGLASLPAPNMESMDMAAGGIVAFADPSNDQEVKDESSYFPEGSSTDKKIWYALTHPSEAFAKFNATEPSKKPKLTKEEVDLMRRGVIKSPTMAAFNATPPEEQLVEVPPMAAPLPNPSAAPTTPPPPPAGLAAAAARRPAMPPAQPAPAAPLPPPAGDLSAQDYDTRRKASMEEAMSFFKDELASNKKAEAGLDKIRTQGSGEALMMIAAAVMGTPNMSMAMAKGLPLVAAQSASVRKELDTLQGKIDDRNLALKKATKAYEQGDMKAYTEYMDTVSQADYRIKSAANGLITANASKLSAEASMVRATSDKTATQAANKMDIAIGNAVEKSIAERHKTDYKFRTQWDKMSPDQQLQFTENEKRRVSASYNEMPAGGGMNLDSLSSQADAILKSRQPKQ